jgi:hypothetical protein
LRANPAAPYRAPEEVAVSETDEPRAPEVSATFAEAQRRRADLHQALIEVERAASRPAVGREAEWSADVVTRLRSLAEMIDEHVEMTERPKGLYDEITGRAPRLASQIERLKAEHPEMRDATAELLGRFEATPIGDAWPIADARDGLQRLLGRLVRHRQHGADLVWEAYNLDIGGIE